MDDLDPHAQARQQQMQQQGPFGASRRIRNATAAYRHPHIPRGSPAGGSGTDQILPPRKHVDVDDMFGGGEIGDDLAHINHGNGNRGNVTGGGGLGTGLLALLVAIVTRML